MYVMKKDRNKKYLATDCPRSVARYPIEYDKSNSYVISLIIVKEIT